MQSSAVEANDDAAIIAALKRLGELTYATTGNGAYLVSKGMFKP